MKKSHIPFTLIVLFAMATKSLFAQTTNFSGTWAQKEKTNLSGKDYANAIPAKIKFEQTAAEITLTRTEIAPDENSEGPSSIEKLTLEAGKGITGKTAEGRKITTGAVITGKTLTETTVITVPNENKVAYNIKDVYTMSGDGKTLTLVKTFENTLDATDKWSTRGVYENSHSR